MQGAEHMAATDRVGYGSKIVEDLDANADNLKDIFNSQVVSKAALLTMYFQKNGPARSSTHFQNQRR